MLLVPYCWAYIVGVWGRGAGSLVFRLVAGWYGGSNSQECGDEELSYRHQFKVQSFVCLPAYSTPSYNKDNKYADITITSQSDERILDGSSQWRSGNG
ncbi:hypothetical protein OUZ56_010953 [Daphnia magna]|uniref:Secreted protein n=1 Tax=Daphnia magna TaxID=35525 RepID=A0ABQ9YZ02_9CRUS|nr:hypothetical protein OUZ56_010953 [Daphnia magna]